MSQSNDVSSVVSTPTIVVSVAPIKPVTYAPIFNIVSDPSMYDDGQPESSPPSGVISSSRVPPPSEVGEYANAEMMGLADAIGDNVLAATHVLLTGKSTGMQAAILFKSLMVYLSTHVEQLSLAMSMATNVLKVVPNNMREVEFLQDLDVITFSDIYVWRSYVASMVKAVYNYGSCYNTAIDMVFDKVGEFEFKSPTLKMDMSLHPFYVSYTSTNASGSSTDYNPPLVFKTATGSLFTEDMKYMYMYSYAMFFKHTNNKGHSFRPFEYPGMENGRTVGKMLVLSQHVINTVRKNWTCPSNYTTTAAFCHLIHWSLTAQIDTEGKGSPLIPYIEGTQVWAAKYLYDLASKYYIALNQQQGPYTTPKMVLDSFRAMRQGGVLNQEWCKDPTKVGAMTRISSGANVGRYVVGRTVVMKSLVSLEQIRSLKPDCVLYAGIANHNNYQASYAHDFLKAEGINFLSFDIVSRSGTYTADATNPADVRMLYDAATTVLGEKVKSVVFMCDIDTTGTSNDNKKPIAIADNIIESCPRDVKLLAIYNKGTVFADIPALHNVGYGSMFLRDTTNRVVSGRKHNGECVILTIPNAPNKAIFSPLNPRYLTSMLAVHTVQLMSDLFESNVFRGFDISIKPFQVGVRTAISYTRRLVTDCEFEFVPLPKRQEKSKADQLPELDQKAGTSFNQPHVAKSKDGLSVAVVFPEGMSDQEVGEWIEVAKGQFGLVLDKTASPRTYVAPLSNLTTHGIAYVRTL